METTRKSILGLCCIAAISCTLFYMLQQFTGMGYVGTAIGKMFFFSGVPLVYYRWVYSKEPKKVLHFRTTLKQSRKRVVPSSLGILF